MTNANPGDKDTKGEPKIPHPYKPSTSSMSGFPVCGHCAYPEENHVNPPAEAGEGREWPTEGRGPGISPGFRRTPTSPDASGEVCPCWCHQDPQPEYDSHRDYFGTHNSLMKDGKPDCPNCTNPTPVPPPEKECITCGRPCEDCHAND